VCICALDNDTDFASGFPPSGWSDAGGLSNTTIGGDWATRAMQRTEASATTVATAVVGTLSASTSWRTLTFALIPEPASFTGTVAETQDAQTATAAGWITVTGTVAATQAAQTSSASGVLGYSGTLARTQDNQTSTASGTVSGGGVSGSLAETQDNQTSTASGVLGYTGTLARTQANQTSAANGVLGYSGTLARTQANQTSTASGTVAAGITGTVAATQANQTPTASGVLGYTGTAARTQANQTASAAGWILISGTLAETQDNQTIAAAGKNGFNGTLARTQASQVASAAGFVGEIPGIPEHLELSSITDVRSLASMSSPLTLTAIDPAFLEVPPAIAGQGYQLVFYDDFETLNHNVWTNMPWYTWKPEAYSITDGVLTISPADNSSELVSLGTRAGTIPHHPNAVAFEEGYFEARISYGPASLSFTPAFWPWGVDRANQYPESPCSPVTLQTEWDIMENFHSPDNPQQFHCGTHTNTGGGCSVADVNEQRFVDTPSSLAGGWHIYGGLWAGGQLRFYVDQIERATIAVPAAFVGQPMALTLSQSLQAGASTSIDWVRVWQQP
jgi:hypothetical protein